MAIIEESINIKSPVNKVFLYTLDIKSWPKWFSSITDAAQTSQGQVGIGTTFTATNKGMGMKVKMTGKVTGYEQNKTWSKDYGARSINTKVRYSFVSFDGGTKLVQQFDITITGFMKLFSSMLVNSIHKQMKVALNNLKVILESEA